MIQTTRRFSVHVEHVDGFELVVRFEAQLSPLRLDEPAPIGHDLAPKAGRILAAAIGNCLSASLAFCLRKARLPALLPAGSKARRKQAAAPGSTHRYAKRSFPCSRT